MTRRAIAIIGLFLLAGCSGGGEESAPASQSSQPPAPPPATPPTAAPTAFLVATAEGLWRGDTSGKGGVVLTRPNLQQSKVFLGDEHVFYHRVRGQGPDTDIWTVNADGTGDHALVTDPNAGDVVQVKGPWAFYGSTDGTCTWKSVRADTGQQSVVADLPACTFFLQRLVGGRAVFSDDLRITSANFDGSDYRTHIDFGVHPDFIFPLAAVEPDTIIYEAYALPQKSLYALVLPGTSPILLDDGVSYNAYAGNHSGRVVSQRCKTGSSQCDVWSVKLDGSQPVVLALQPENEAVQGIVGDKVVIRRNVSGNDQLVSVPITGGAESLITMLTDNDFIETVAGDSLVLRRSTGTWRLDLNGALTKLGPTAGGRTYQVVGNAVCYNVNAALYCSPLDGSGPEVRIDRNGKIVGVL